MLGLVIIRNAMAECLWPFGIYWDCRLCMAAKCRTCCIHFADGVELFQKLIVEYVFTGEIRIALCSNCWMWKNDWNSGFPWPAKALEPSETNYSLMTVYPKQTVGKPQASKGQNDFALCWSRKKGAQLYAYVTAVLSFVPSAWIIHEMLCYETYTSCIRNALFPGR